MAGPETVSSAVPRSRSRYLWVALVAATWAWLTPIRWKLIGTMLAAAFAVVETLFNGLTIDEHRRAKHQHRLNVWRMFWQGHTSWEQFWALVFWSPVCHFLFFELVQETWLRILLFPINVWLAEIFMGSFLKTFWQRRPWNYTGRWAYFDGNITLLYGPLWVLLGVQHVIFVAAVYVPLSEWIVTELLGWS
eukprot:TRINITY_DN2495_c0_g1_i1.p2 TRINITY_DN2495_c0_g1~~TRINITY_DN2495_c0_g1_i1.p2  ORF type:complete len:191 (-),score=77.54 TRINITY_DN2495_c0_g1_i1:183-755(-)